MAGERSISDKVMAWGAAFGQWFSTPAGMRVKRIGTILLSVVIILILVRSIADIGWQEVLHALPASPAFWLAYLASYFIQPVVDFLIYRRWWVFGWKGIAVFLKKRVMNESLIAYSGETYLMAWAAKLLDFEFDPNAKQAPILGRDGGEGLDPREHPLAAIKDVNITSGLAGNLVTLLMLLVALAMGGDEVLSDTLDPDMMRRLSIGFAMLVLLSLSILGFRNRVFSLPTRENLWSGWMHFGRVSAQHVLFTLSWIIALPMIPLDVWILLGALRLVIMRLPVPNKEILFAAIAVSLTGSMGVHVQALMAAQGALHLVMHAFSWAVGTAIEETEPGKAAGAIG